jgi:flagellar protein FliJ
MHGPGSNGSSEELPDEPNDREPEASSEAGPERPGPQGRERATVRKFRFRLEQVLRVRMLQEDQARGELMVANRAAQEAAARVENRLDEYKSRSLPEGPQSYEAFERALFMLDSAAGAVDVARLAHRETLEVVDVRRAEWAAARRKVAALERLEERRREEHAIEVRRAEDRLVDDLVVARHGRLHGSLAAPSMAPLRPHDPGGFR